MKKINLFIIILSISNVHFSQSTEKKVYLTAFYGFGNIIFTDYHKSSSYLYPNIDSKTGKGIYPIGLRSEIKFKKIGYGLDLIYNSVSRSNVGEYWTIEGSLISDYSRTYKQLRILGRVNFYLIQKDKVNLYFGLGAGFKMIKTRQETETNTGKYNLHATDYFPSFRVCFGQRYMLNKKLSLSIETGLGGSILSAGVSYKLGR